MSILEWTREKMRSVPPAFLSNVTSRKNVTHYYENLCQSAAFSCRRSTKKYFFRINVHKYSMLSAELCSVIFTIILYSLPQMNINSFRWNSVPEVAVRCKNLLSLLAVSCINAETICIDTWIILDSHLGRRNNWLLSENAQMKWNA